MKEYGFLIIFFVGLFVLALGTQGGNGIFSNFTSTSSPLSRSTSTPERTEVIQNAPLFTTQHTPTTNPVPTPPPPPKLTPLQIEQKVANLYRELDRLTEEVRRAKLREPTSPYSGLVTLRQGNTSTTDVNREYLMLYANSRNAVGVDISNWYVKSYVTDEVAALPQGDRVLLRWRSPEKTDITLEPGEQAYLITGESPIDTSFHENRCTGYLTQTNVFPMNLSNQCPRPLDEMKKYGNIALDNDSCYGLVGRLQTCRIPDDSLVNSYNPTNSCRVFIDTTLNYDDCVAKHKNDPFFDDVGQWHIFLQQHEELWRPKREIIRLMDEKDRVIDVIEY